jgi:hypothetical protein
LLRNRDLDLGIRGPELVSEIILTQLLSTIDIGTQFNSSSKYGRQILKLPGKPERQGTHKNTLSESSPR